MGCCYFGRNAHSLRDKLVLGVTMQVTHTTIAKPRRAGLLAVAAVAALLSVAAPAVAQFAGQGARDSFIDTSVLKPAAGSRVSILVFEDLGCPACAAAHHYELDAAQKEHVPLVRRDFPLAQHIWTFDGAVFARYLEDKVSPKVAAEYRTDVFASQRSISSKDDLQSYDALWMKRHSLPLPSPLDPGGALAAKVKADFDLGQRLNVTRTPTIVVVTNDRYQVVCGTVMGSNDPGQLDAVVQGALVEATPHTTAAR